MSVEAWEKKVGLADASGTVVELTYSPPDVDDDSP